MNFKLLSIEDGTMDDRCDGDEEETDHETYKMMQQPIATSKEKMKANKTAECPKCNKLMSKKTLEYSHKCSTPKPPPPEAPTKESLYEYILEKERNTREQHREKKREEFSRMMSNAF